MRILDRSVYVGPSLYARFPVIRLELDLGELEAWPTGRLGARLRRRRCSRRCPGSPSTAAPTASPAASSAACARTRAPGSATCSSTWRSSCRTSPARRSPSARRAAPGRPGVYTVVYEYAQREEGIAAGELGAAPAVLAAAGRRCARPAACPQDWDWPEARDEFIRFAQRRALGPSTASLVRAAEERGIPWLRLNDQSLVQLGHGKYQQRIQATVTGRTPHIAVELASDKEETNKILADLGLPVPQAGAGAERDAGGARRAALGFPVVTKPYNGNHGRGISIRLTSDDGGGARLHGGARALALGDRRDLPRGRRPPPAGGQRRAGRRHAAHARATWSATASTRSRSWSRS